MIMSHEPANNDDGFHVVVAEDGSLPAGELARLGFRPGAHLRLVPEQPATKHKSMAGALKDAVPPEAVEDLLRGLDEAKAERIAYFADQHQA
jgi:hypothetical protein